MSERTVEAVNQSAEAYNTTRQGVIEALNDPEAAPGSLSEAADQAEAARAEYDAAVLEHQLEAGL